MRVNGANFRRSAIEWMEALKIGVICSARRRKMPVQWTVVPSLPTTAIRHFPPSPFREDLIDLPVREPGGTSTARLAVAGGVHIGRADGLRRGALRLQERVGYPVAESQQAGSGQCYRQ